MRTIDEYHTQNDEYFHPLWLGIIILFSVISIIGLFCCVRMKYGTPLRILFNRICCRKVKKHDNSLSDEKSSTRSYSYNWPPIFTSTRSPSPKLYTLIKNIRTAKLEKQLSIRQASCEEENEIHPTVESEYPQLCLPEPTDDTRASEIARKFYASMRNTSNGQNSSSVDSYNNDASLASTDPSIITNQTINSKREEGVNSFHTPKFFKSIPKTDGPGIII